MKLGKSQCGTVEGAGTHRTAAAVHTQRINKMFLLAAAATKQKAAKMTQRKKKEKKRIATKEDKTK